MRRPSPLVPLALPLLLAACQGPVFHADRTEAGPWPEGAGLAVESRNGSIEVSRVSGSDYRVRARLHGPDEDRLGRAAIRVEELDGVVRISPRWPEGAPLHDEGCSLVIEVPAAAGMELRTSNGAIRFGGFTGRALATTSNGSIEVEGLDGAVELCTSNGRILARDIGGPLRAETSNGGITAVLRPQNPGPASLSTSNGEVLLQAPGLAGLVEATTSNGTVAVEGEAEVERRSEDRVLVRRAGEGSSRVVTSNAEILVRFDS